MTMVDKQELRVLLEGMFGKEARILRETRGKSGELTLHWAPVAESGAPPLGKPPALIVEADGRTLRWDAPAAGYRSASFSIADLAEANPRRVENLDKRTRAVAAELKALATTADLIDASGGIAVAVALGKAGLAPDAVAALVAAADQLDYWVARQKASNAWRYSPTAGNLALSPPFSEEEALSAERIADDVGLRARILEAGGVDSDEEIWLPVLANPRAGPISRGRTPEHDR